MTDLTVKNKSKTFPQYVATLSACLGALGFGTILGWTGNITDKLLAGKYNNIQMNESELGWVGSLVNLGATCACLPFGVLCNTVGCKNASLLLTIPFILGWSLIVMADSLTTLMLGRFVTGTAGGCLCIATPVYISEIAEKDIRGNLGTYFQLMIKIGILVSYVLGYVMEVKLFTTVVMVVPVVFCVVFAFQPQSPVYVMKKGQEKEVVDILHRLRGKDYDVEVEMSEIRETLETNSNDVNILNLFKKPSTRFSIGISFTAMVFQQACGINAVIFYSTSVLSTAGSGLEPSYGTIITGTIMIASTVLSSYVIDRIGRKPLLLISSSIMALSLEITGTFFTLKERQLVSDDVLSTLNFMPVLGIALYLIGFSMGYGPVPWILTTELYTGEIRNVGTSITACFSWFLAFLVTKFYGDLKNAVGVDVTFHIFTVMCVLGIAFVLALVPETKCKSLADIQKDLQKNN